MRTELGQRVTVAQCSGLESGISGVVVHKSIIPTNGRGVPMLGLGHYCPMASSEVAIRDDSGRLFTMFCNRLKCN